MPFAHAQASANGDTSINGATTLSVSLTNAPAVGDVVCVSVCSFDGGITVSNVQDGNGNVYTKSPQSPSNTNPNTVGYSYLFYWIATGTPHKTITATFSSLVAANGDIVAMIIDDFTVSGGTASFDIDASGAGFGTTVSTPTLTPTNPNSLVYAGIAGGGSAVVNSPWTGTTNTNYDTATGEYQLSVTASQNPNLTQANTLWDSMMMAFYIVPAISGQGYGAAVQEDYSWGGGDDN